MTIAPDDFYANCLIFGLFGGTNPPPGPSFSPALTKFVAVNGINTLPGTRNEPNADPAYAMTQIAAPTSSNAWGIAVAPGSYSVATLALKPSVTIIGDLSAQPVLTVTAAISLDASWAGTSGSTFTFQNMFIGSAIALDFSLYALTAGRLTSVECFFVNTVSLTAKTANSACYGEFRSCYFSQNVTLNSAYGRFTNCYLLSNLVIQPSASNGNATVEWYGGNISGSVSITGNGSSSMLAIFRGTRLASTLTITGTQVQVEIDSGSWPLGGIVLAGGATLAQITVERAPFLNSAVEKIYYVDQFGSDTPGSGSGNIELPWASVSFAQSQLSGQSAAVPYLIKVSGIVSDIGTISLKPNIHIYLENGASLTNSNPIGLDSSWTAGGTVSIMGPGTINGALNLDLFAIGGSTSGTVNIGTTVAGAITFTSRNAGAGIPLDSLFIRNARLAGVSVTIKGGNITTQGNYSTSNIIVNNGAANAVNAIWNAYSDVYQSGNIQLTATGSNTVVVTHSSSYQPTAGTATGAGVTWTMDAVSYKAPTIVSSANVVLRNLSANNFLKGYTSTATAAGTTTLTVSSTQQQFFTGSTTQTVTLPVASTLTLGQSFNFVNQSSGVVTVQSSGGNTVLTLAANSSGSVTCILTSGTSAASWYAEGSATYALLGANNVFTKRQAISMVAISSSGGITSTDGSASNYFSSTLTENTVLQNPTNLVAGTWYTWDFTQSASTPFTVALDTIFQLVGPAWTMTTTLSAHAVVSGFYNGSKILWSAMQA